MCCFQAEEKPHLYDWPRAWWERVALQHEPHAVRDHADLALWPSHPVHAERAATWEGNPVFLLLRVPIGRCFQFLLRCVLLTRTKFVQKSSLAIATFYIKCSKTKCVRSHKILSKVSLDRLDNTVNWLLLCCWSEQWKMLGRIAT